MEHHRGFGLDIPGVAVLFAPVIQKRIPQHHSFGMEKRHAGGLFVKTEQIQLLAQLAVVAFFGLFQKMQVCFELLFVKKGRTVYPLQLRIALIGPPVGTRDTQHFCRSDKTGMRHMRAAAQDR